MEIKFDLNKEDIIKEIRNNYLDDVEFLFKIVSDSTNRWESLREVTKKLIELLKEKGEINDLLENI